MLPELMYQRLQEGLLPKAYPSKTILEQMKEQISMATRRVSMARNSIVKSLKLVSPMAVRKAVSITGSKFSGYRVIARNAYIGKYGDELTYEVYFKNNLYRPTIAKITQKIGEVERTTSILFKPKESRSYSVTKKLTRPESLTCSASATSELGLFRYDSISERYDVGLFDDRYKPVEEYPVSGVDNAALDVAYDWTVGTFIYPTPLPEGLSIEKISVSLKSGFISFEDKNYKDPAVNNTIRISARIINRTGDILTIKHWGLPLSVLYEDNKHVSQINVNVSISDRTLYGYGEYYDYHLDINLPNWCYGKVAIAHAMNFYKGKRTFIYGGGPFICLECFRLRLP